MTAFCCRKKFWIFASQTLGSLGVLWNPALHQSSCPALPEQSGALLAGCFWAIRTGHIVTTPACCPAGRSEVFAFILAAASSTVAMRSETNLLRWSCLGRRDDARSSNCTAQIGPIFGAASLVLHLPLGAAASAELPQRAKMIPWPMRSWPSSNFPGIRSSSLPAQLPWLHYGISPPVLACCRPSLIEPGCEDIDNVNNCPSCGDGRALLNDSSAAPDWPLNLLDQAQVSSQRFSSSQGCAIGSNVFRLPQSSFGHWKNHAPRHTGSPAFPGLVLPPGALAVNECPAANGYSRWILIALGLHRTQPRLTKE